jgi:peptidoglycan/xylan/chitin deacetylase (PgdA/CDA1 family)
MKKIILRMDDVGASSKKYEVYSKLRIGNILFLKYLKPFKAWGPYKETTEDELDKIFLILSKYNAKLTIGVTSTWINSKNQLIPFYKKFPKQALKLKEGIKNNLIEVANHGLTHCVVGKHLPRLFTSNRKFHREFWDYLGQDLHNNHIQKSQKIFKDWLGTEPISFIPPGNVYSNKTIKSIKNTNILIINSSKKMNIQYGKIKYVNEDNVIPFHDREISLYGTRWLEEMIVNVLNKYDQVKFLNLKDLL